MLVTKREIARELQASLRSIDYLIQRRKIPYYRLSNRFIRFDLDKVRKALDKFEVHEVGRRLA